MTVVVNCRTEEYDIYVGRPGILGNPFRIGRDGTREEVISQHMTYARDRMKRDPKFRDAVLACKGKRLGCWCAPLPCHADNYVILVEEVLS